MNTEKFSDAMNEIDPRYIEEAVQYRPKVLRPGWKRWAAAAACLTLAVLSAFWIGETLSQPDQPAPLIPQTAPAADAPGSMRKFLNYNGYRYVFLENGASYQLEPQQLGEALGTLEYDIQADPEANAGKEFSATYALGGAIRQLTGYDPAFRVAVELDGSFYVCQAVGRTDNTPLDIQAHFQAAGFPEAVESASILDHSGTQVLQELSADQSRALAASLALCSPAELTNDQYQEIGSAQQEGRSYLVALHLNDGTDYTLYVIPSLNIGMIGDNRCWLPEGFLQEFGELFEGLEALSPPMQ